MKSNLKIFGEFPKRVYRFFKEEKYAVDFVENGKFRLGLLRNYQKIECDNRRDNMEGEAHYRLSGPVESVIVSQEMEIQSRWVKEGIKNVYSSYAGNVFILSCSFADARSDVMREKMGSFVVEIKGPISLALDIDATINQDQDSPLCITLGSKVEYSQGNTIQDERNLAEQTELTWFQKPIHYQDESEYRLCLIEWRPNLLMEKAIDNYFYIDLGGSIDYSEIIRI